MKSSIRLLSLFSFLTASLSQAEPALVITFATLPDRVRAQNPELASAHLLIREAQARSGQMGLRSNPELQIGLEHNRSFNEGRVEVGLSQRFPVTDRLRREKSLSKTQINIAENEVRAVERSLVHQARVALIEVLALREKRSLIREQTEVSANLVESLRKAAEKGEASALDAGQARIESLQLAAEARQLEAQETAALSPLKPLLGVRPEQGLVVGGKLPPLVRNAGGTGFDRPDLDAARLATEIASQEIGIEESRRYEDIEAGIVLSADRSEDAPDGLRTDGFLGFQLKIPLPLWNQNEGGIAEAKARYERKRLEHVALVRSARLEVTTTRDEMREWAALADEITRKLQPLADEQVVAAEAAWRNGQSQLQTVLRAREQRLQLAASRIDALREFHLAAARHQAATGQP